MQYVLIK